MNTKRVEDGMSDELSAKQRVRQVWPEAVCMNSATGEKSIWSTDDFGNCEALSTETPEAVIRFFPSEEQAWIDAASKLPSATPEELTPQPAVPVEERTRVLMEALKAVENERLDMHEKYLNPDGEGFADTDFSYSHAIHDAENAIKKLITTPVPEERTTDNMQPRFGTCNHHTGDGNTAVDIYGVCTHCGEIMQGSVQLNTSFTPPEERTAKMDKLLYEFREQIAAEVRKHHDESPQEVAGFILTIKPDHIEGKAKAESQEVQE